MLHKNKIRSTAVFRFNGPMPHKLFDGIDIGARFEKVRGERMHYITT